MPRRQVGEMEKRRNTDAQKKTGYFIRPLKHYEVRVLTVTYLTILINCLLDPNSVLRIMK